MRPRESPYCQMVAEQNKIAIVRRLGMALPKQQNSFLAELSSTELAALRPHLVPLELRVGDRLHSIAVAVDKVVFPHSGVVALGIAEPEGIGPGILVGRGGVIRGFVAASRSPAVCDAEACASGQAHYIPAPAFRSLAENSPAIRRLLGKFETARLARLQLAIRCHASHLVEARICRCLVELQELTGTDEVPITQAMMAQMLGVRRTTVTLNIHRLEKAEVLRSRRGHMHIMNPGALKRHSCVCNTQLHEYLEALFDRR